MASRLAQSPRYYLYQISSFGYVKQSTKAQLDKLWKILGLSWVIFGEVSRFNGVAPTTF